METYYQNLINCLMNPNEAFLCHPPFPPHSKFSEEKQVVKTQDCVPRAACYIGVKESRKPINKIAVFFRSSLNAQYEQHNQRSQRSQIQELLKKKNGFRKRKNSSDDDYNVKNQKKDRNVISNIVHHLFKYLLSNPEIPDLAAQIILSKKLAIKVDEFTEIMIADGNNLKTYVTAKHIKELWFSPSASRKQYCKVMRILSKYFFNKHGFISIYSSNKFNKISKHNHYIGLRTMLEVLSKKQLDELP